MDAEYYGTASGKASQSLTSCELICKHVDYLTNLEELWRFLSPSLWLATLCTYSMKHSISRACSPRYNMGDACTDDTRSTFSIPLNLYRIFFHTFTAESTMQGDSQLVKRVQGEVSCSGIELANFRLPVNPLYVAVVGT